MNGFAHLDESGKLYHCIDGIGLRGMVKEARIGDVALDEFSAGKQFQVHSGQVVYGYGIVLVVYKGFDHIGPHVLGPTCDEYVE